MAGRPPVISESYDGRVLKLEFNENPSTPFADVLRAIVALKKHDVFSADTTVERTELHRRTRITVTIPRPNTIPNRRSAAFQPWLESNHSLVKTVAICVQSQRQSAQPRSTRQLVARVSSRLAA